MQDRFQYFEKSEKQMMLDLEKTVLKEETTLTNMEYKMNRIDTFLKFYEKEMKWWKDQSNRYELLYTRERHGAGEQELKRIKNEIYKNSRNYSEEEFLEKYLALNEHNEMILWGSKFMKEKLETGISIYKKAAIKEINEKYPELRGTQAGEEIAPRLKQLNVEKGRNLTRSEIEKMSKKSKDPSINKIAEVFEKAEQEKKLFLEQEKTKTQQIKRFGRSRKN